MELLSSQYFLVKNLRISKFPVHLFHVSTPLIDFTFFWLKREKLIQYYYSNENNDSTTQGSGVIELFSIKFMKFVLKLQFTLASFSIILSILQEDLFVCFKLFNFSRVHCLISAFKYFIRNLVFLTSV